VAPASPPPLLTIWAVSDDKAGNANQALGLAEAVQRLVPAAIATKRIAWRAPFGRLPTRLIPPGALSPDADPIAPPWPDLWIGTGRASVPLGMRMKGWSEGRTFVVHTQHPRVPASRFDLVAPPKHDRLAGPNVFPITGAPHRVTPGRLAAELAQFEAMLAPLPSPRAAVLIGGRSKAYDLSPERAGRIADALDAALEKAGASLLLTFSRRTPAPARRIIAERLAERPGIIWNDQGPNPYFAFLAAADYIAVTEDSTNMLVEAASTGRPIFVIGMDGAHARKRAFHADLEARGAARPFGGEFYGWTYAPLRETERLAEEVVRRMAERA